MQLDRIFETISRRNASEAWIMAGFPPTIVVEGQPRQLSIEALTLADQHTLIGQLLSEGQLDRLKDSGLAWDEVRYGETMKLSVIVCGKWDAGPVIDLRVKWFRGP